MITKEAQLSARIALQEFTNGIADSTIASHRCMRNDRGVAHVDTITFLANILVAIEALGEGIYPDL